MKSKYKAMWLLAMFDLPMNTKPQRRRYTQFRNFLIAEGFSRLQFSVYARYCAGEESANTYRNHIQKELPQDGEVRLISITDVQFGKMQIFLNAKPQCTKPAPKQFLLF